MFLPTRVCLKECDNENSIERNDVNRRAVISSLKVKRASDVVNSTVLIAVAILCHGALIKTLCAPHVF